MKYHNVYCNSCNTNFTLEEDTHGCCLGVCNCQDVGEDLGLEDTVIERIRQKQNIKDYFRQHDGEVLGYGDIAGVLQISLSIVVELCDELESEGIIGMASDSLMEKRRSEGK